MIDIEKDVLISNILEDDNVLFNVILMETKGNVC